jgi:hypothetical protein
MRTSADIISDLGGPAAVARETSIPLTTVHSWCRSNFIPEWRQPKIIELARRKKKSLVPADFPTVEYRISRRAMA